MTDYLGSAVLEVTANLNPLRASLLEAERMSAASLRKMQAEQATRMGVMSTSMATIGSRMSRSLTLPILGIAGASTKMSVNFDRAMEMIHTQAGASQKEVDKLKDKVLDLGKAVPFGPQQLADALFHIESIGARLQPKMAATGGHVRKLGDAMGMLKAAAEGAAVGHAKLEDTATALGSAWLVGIKGAGNFHKTMGILNATVGAGNMRMDELVHALGTGLLPMAKLAGLSITDTMAALAVFTDEGFNASSAATQMATALHYLTKPTDKASKALAGVGMTNQQLAADMHKPKGLLVALRDLQDHMDKAFPDGRKLTRNERAAQIEKVKKSLQDAGVHGKVLDDQISKFTKRLDTKGYAAVQQEAVLGDIFPAGRGRVMQVLINQLDRYGGPDGKGGKLAQISKTQKNFGEDIKRTMEQPAVRVQQAWARLQASLVKFGEEVGPPLIDMGTKVLALATRTVDKFNSLDPKLKHQIVTGGLILAGIGPAMRVLGLFTTGIDKLWRLQGKLNTLGRTGVGKAAAGQMTLASMTVENMTVANMEVANMIVRGYAGGGGAPGGTGTPAAGPGGRPGPAGGPIVNAAHPANVAEEKRLARLALAEGTAVGSVGPVERMSQAEARALLDRYGRLHGSARVMATQGGYKLVDASKGGAYDVIRGGRRMRYEPRYGEPGSLTEDPAMRYLREQESRQGPLESRYAAYQRELETGVLGVGKDGKLVRVRNPLKGAGRRAVRRLGAGGVRGVGGRAMAGLGTAGMIFMGGQMAEMATGSKAVGAIGNYAAMGAMAGSLFGPEGTIIGALGGALVGGVTHLFKSKTLEQKVADSLGKSSMFQGDLTPAQKQAAQTADARRKQAAHDVARATQLAEQSTQAAAGPRFNEQRWRMGNPQRPGETSAQYQRRVDAARDAAGGAQRRTTGQQRVFENLAGIRLGQALGTELGTFKHVDATAVTNQFTRIFSNPKLNDQMRAAGAHHILAWAQGMEKAGRLPKGAAQEIFTNIEADFPGITRKFHLLGINSMAGLSSALKSDAATQATQKTITAISSEWAGMPPLLKNTAGNMTKNVATELGYLHDQALSTTGKTRKDAIAEFEKLRHQALGSFKGLRDQTNQSFSDMSAGIKSNTGTARHDAVHNFNQLFSQVNEAVASGVISTSHGAALIVDSLNSLLVAFGGTPIPKGALNKAQTASLAGAIASGAIRPGEAPSGAAVAAPHARGGTVQFGKPGQKGRDSIPVNFGGVPVVVGAGEVGAVFTGEQQAVADAFLAPVGGLNGLFANHNRPHWAGFERGGLLHKRHYSKSDLMALWRLAGGRRGSANIAAAIALAESAGDPEAGHQHPYHGLWQIGPGGPFDPLANAKEAVRKSGNGRNWNPWTTYTGFDTPGHERTYLRFLGGGADSSLLDMVVRSPRLDGKGTIAHIARLGLHKATAAANQYLNKQLDKQGASGASAGPVSGPAGTVSFDGHAVARWIVPILRWARAHGWKGSVQSGWRDPREVVHGVFATAPQGQSEHQGTQYPHGAVDVSEYEDFGRIIAGYHGPRSLIPATGFYDPLHFSGTGHARGGFIGMQGGGPVAHAATYPRTRSQTRFPSHASHSSSSSSSKSRVTSTKKAKAKAPARLPRLRAPKDFKNTNLDTLGKIDTVINELSAWQSFIQGLHGAQPMQSTLTDDKGAEYLNWGADDLGLPPTMLTGGRDSAGQQTKGIWDRVREIGNPSDRVTIGRTDLNATELGLAETILQQELQQRAAAMRAGFAFGAWYPSEKRALRNDERADAFITKGLDSTTPYDALPHAPFSLGSKIVFHGKKRITKDYAKMVRQRVRDFKRTLARIIRTRLRAGFLPEERRHAHEAITRRYAALREKLKKRHIVSKGSLLAEQHAALTVAERETLRGIPSQAPRGWQGDRQSWTEQAKDERMVVLNEFTMRRAGLSGASLKDQMSGAEAASHLSVREVDERSKVSDIYDGKERNSRKLVQQLSQRRDRDRNFLREWQRNIKGRASSERSSIASADGADGLREQIKAFLDPTGTLGINIATKQNIDIPNLIREAEGLKGSKLTGAGAAGGVDSALAGLLQQQNAMLGQQLAISQAQYSVLSNLHIDAPPFGGHFAEGGIVPGPTGAARTIIAHGGERVLTKEQQGGVQVIVQDGAVNADRIKVIANGEVQKVTRGAARGASRRLPSGGGG